MIDGHREWRVSGTTDHAPQKDDFYNDLTQWRVFLQQSLKIQFQPKMHSITNSTLLDFKMTSKLTK